MRHRPLKKAKRELTLGELEAFAGAGTTGLLTFLLTGVARHHAGGFESGAKFCIEEHEGTGDTVTKSTGLTDVSAARDIGDDVEVSLFARDDERLDCEAAHGFGGEIIFKGTFVDGDFASPRNETDTRTGGLASADCNVNFVGLGHVFPFGSLVYVNYELLTQT